MKTPKTIRCFLAFLCTAFLAVISRPLTSTAETSAVTQKVQQVAAAVITSGMSEKDKAAALHDWLTDHAYYDLTYTHYDADGVLLYGTGVCESYAKAYKLLLEAVGIDCYILTGTAVSSDGTTESHAWNLVKIDGKWSHVDVTWDDPIDPDNLESKALKSGNEHHIYFLAGNRFILEDHIPDAESKAIMDNLTIEEETVLPNPVKTTARVESPDFELKTSKGTLLTKSGYGSGKKLMIIYGRIICSNTLAFLSQIAEYIEPLRQSGMTVVLALFDDPSVSEMQEMESRYPGIICTKLTENDYSMWESLTAFNYSDTSVYFPVVILKNSNNKMTYYSAGYVENPLSIVAGALQMPDEAYVAPVSDQKDSGEDTEPDKSDTDKQTTESPDKSDTGKQTTESPDKSGSKEPTSQPDQTEKEDSKSAEPVTTVTVSGGVYKLNLKKKTAALQGVKSKNIKTLKIAAVVKANGTSYKVTSIAVGACKGLKKLTSVTIGKNVSVIGKNSFTGCTKLKTVSGGKAVVTIQAGAFSSCSRLTSVPTFAKAKAIGAKAFQKCKALKSFTFGTNISSIGKYAFDGCTSLKKITIKSKKLKASKTGVKAFNGIGKKAEIKVPKSLKKSYKKLLVSKGAPKTILIS